eukprot:TCONS_00010865-protein
MDSSATTLLMVYLGVVDAGIVPSNPTPPSNYTTPPATNAPPPQRNGIGNLQIWEISFICIGIILFLVTMAIVVGWFANKNKRVNYDELDDSNKLFLGNRKYYFWESETEK